MKIEKEAYSKTYKNIAANKYQKLVLDDHTYAEVINITDTKIRIGLVTQNNLDIRELSPK